MKSEALIIGGGVIGLSIGRELHKQGVKRITLLERGRCGEEASWAAAGMLSPQAEANEPTPLFELCRASRDMYPKFADELSEEIGVDIELDQAGTLYLAFTDEGVAEIRNRFEWQHKAGLAIEHLSAGRTLQIEPSVSPKVREALLFPNDWQVENRKLLAALRLYAEMNGIKIHENTHVKNLVVEDSRVTGATTDRQVFTADVTVAATGAWTSLIKLGAAQMPVSIEPVRGQIISFSSKGDSLRHVVCSSRGYLVPRRDGRILAGSTSENVGFDRSLTETAADSLVEMAAEIAPEIGRLEIADHWSGLRPFASDGLPVLGPLTGVDGLFIAGGHYRNGILLAPLTARLAAEHIITGSNPECFKDFGAERFLSRSIGTSS